MKHVNTKTGLSRKMKTVTGAVTALGAVAAMAMAPTSQALAYQTVTGAGISSTAGTFVYGTFKGHGNTMAKAQADARNGASCAAAGARGAREVDRRWGNGTSMYNGTWYNAFLNVKCKY